MIGLLLVCHGQLAESLLGAVDGIVGPQDDVVAITNEGKAPEVVRSEIAEILQSFAGHEGVIVMADLLGSSCWRNGLECLKEPPTPIAVISGVNLGMLLSFTQKRATLSFSELAEVMANDGKRAISGPRFSEPAK